MKKDKLRFYNTLTRKKEKFVPLQESKVKMYSCGPTVYDFAHIGNFRSFVFNDLLRRWLEYRGFEVKQVMNITDVDDKTIRGSREQNVPFKQYTDFYINAFFEDLDKLNIKKATHFPKATDHIPDMVNQIRILMKKNYAYKSDDNSIYFKISKFNNYGALSKIKVDTLKPGGRVKIDEYSKEEARDFALWKAWDEEDGDVFWETELGKGRPGWHIECSTMAMKYLGEQLDVHCGGIDLIFPHHENEIAQSEAITGKKLVQFWLHNEYLLVEGNKMAKRLGNYYTLRDLLQMGYAPMAIRFLLISTHYRQALNFTFERLKKAKKSVDRLITLLYNLNVAKGNGCDEAIKILLCQTQTKFEDAMDDDLNINLAISTLFSFIKKVNKHLSKGLLSKEAANNVADLIMKFDKVLGIIGERPVNKQLPKKAQELILRREKARKKQDWKTADKIRDQLNAMGIIIEDTPQGIKWRFEKH